MTALKTGLLQNDLLFSLYKKYPKDLSKCWSRRRGMLKQRKPRISKGRTTMVDHDRTLNKEKRKIIDGCSIDALSKGPITLKLHLEETKLGLSWDNTELEPPTWRFHYFITLNTSQAQILIEIECQEELPRSRRMIAPMRAKNPKKYCRHHQDHRQDTEECW